MRGGEVKMKTMTCRQMGGPCDEPIHGSTPEEMMNNGTAHVTSMDDEEHKKVLVMMDEMHKNPEAGKQWTDEFMAKYNELPEE